MKIKREPDEIYIVKYQAYALKIFKSGCFKIIDYDLWGSRFVGANNVAEK